MAYQFDWSVGNGLYCITILESNTTSIKPIYYYYGIIDEIKEGNFGGVRPLKYVDLDGKAPATVPNSPSYNANTKGGRIIQGIGITEWNDGECLFGSPNPYKALSMYESYHPEFYPERHYRSMLVHFERNGEVLYNVWPDKLPQNYYIPFVELGKTWNMVRSDYDSGCHFVQYTMAEEVEKDGKTYIRMYRREKGRDVAYDMGLFREEDRKVYFYDQDMQMEFLLFDYSLSIDQPGSSKVYQTYSYEENKMVWYKLLSVSDYEVEPMVTSYHYDTTADSTTIQRRYLRRWRVYRGDNPTIQKTWIEGVGTTEGPLANLHDVVLPGLSWDYLAYVENPNSDLYLPFSFHDKMNRQIHGCNLPTGAENNEEDDRHHRLTYELEGDRLHVYGEVFTQCGPNNYAYFYERKTDDPWVHKIEFQIQEVEPMMDCMTLHATDFYVPGFDPNLTYIVVDNQGEEHPVVKKAPKVAYRPMIEDGKVWKFGLDDWLSNPVKYVEYYYFDGDTIINGKTCKQMMRQRYVAPDYVHYETYTRFPQLSKEGAWYEEDKKVYLFNERDEQFQIMYDFSLEAYDTIRLLKDYPAYVVGPKQTGGIKGFKGVYRKVENHYNSIIAWLEGIGSYNGPSINVYYGSEGLGLFLMSCTVGDEVIYLNDEYEDGATPDIAEARKRFDFTHTIKTQPKMPTRRSTEQSIYGEYNDMLLAVNLIPLEEAYLVRITDETGGAVYEKTVNAGSIVALNIDIATYPKGHYTVTVENSLETFTGEFDTQTAGIDEVRSQRPEVRGRIYNLQGQRLSSVRKGLNIVNGQKVLVK
jgi:hypothetical protein